MTTWAEHKAELLKAAARSYCIVRLTRAATLAEAARDAGMDRSAFKRLCRGAGVEWVDALRRGQP